MTASPMAEPGMEADSPPADAVPAVVAVMVTSNPGPWLEEALDALGASDYPNLSVLVVDAASEVDPTPRIADRLPSAYVRRLDSNPGYAGSANDVIGVVEGASHYLFLHDDAAPDPDAIRLLVEEAFRSNAGIVAPKLVEWDDPRMLLAVGASADKGGVVRPYGRHELDQEQHDAVRDVFVAPGGCVLVRADLFASLGGFDPRLPLIGEDLDLCWRAQVFGARVVVAPSARVRHREATAGGERPLILGETTGDLRERIARLQLRHRLRTVLKAYSPLHLLRVLPQLIVFMAAEAAGAAMSGRKRLAGAVLDSWRWNVSDLRDLRAARKAAQSGRALKDGEIRRLQTRGSVRLAGALQGRLAVEERTLGVGAAGRQFAGSLAVGGVRQTLAVWSLVALVLLFGSRHLLGGDLPAVGQFVPFPDGPLVLLRHFLSGWRSSGLGSEAPAPPAFALLGMAGVAFAGAMGLLQKVVVLGMLPLALVGMHRVTGPLGSWRVRLVGVVLYAAVPLPYDALARGHWGGLVAYAATPWILSRLLRATGLEPFGAHARDGVARPSERVLAGRNDSNDEVESLLGAEAANLDAIDTEELRLAVTAVTGHPSTFRTPSPDIADSDASLPPAAASVARPGALVFQAAGLALVLAIAGAFVPSITVATLLCGAGLVLGSLLVGGVAAGARALAVAFVAVLGAGLLLLPWTFELLLPGATWVGFAGQGAPASFAPGLGELARFGLGPTGRSPFAWGLLVTATLPLIVGRRWRFTFAARMWVVALVSWGASWVLARGWSGLEPPDVDVLLAPGAAALVLASVLGLSAFEIDVPDYRFGWRQIASLVAGGASLVTTLPVVAASFNGQWRMPKSDFATLLSWMPERRAEGEFRVLWAGHPEALPLDGWRLDDGLAYASSRGGPPDLIDQWPASDQGISGLMADALGVARRGETSRLGHLLAPMGVRYLAVPLRSGPSRSGAPELAVPDRVLGALRAQVDLRLIETDDALVVYENAAWAPAVSVLPAAAVEASRRSGPDAARTAELAGAPPALRRVGPTRYSGPWPGADLYFAEGHSGRWNFEVDGKTAAHRKAFGWANAFEAPAGSRGVLSYRTSPLRYLALLVQVALWIAAVRLVVRGMVRRSTDESADAGPDD